MADIRLEDLEFAEENQSRQEIDWVSTNLDEKGIHRPIKDGLGDDGRGTLSEEEADLQAEPAAMEDEETSEEERELPGVRRPRRGAGWWGLGKPLQPHRKGMGKEFTDGAGLPSPGR